MPKKLTSLLSDHPQTEHCFTLLATRNMAAIRNRAELFSTVQTFGPRNIVLTYFMVQDII
jgi:hypothetical protein